MVETVMRDHMLQALSATPVLLQRLLRGAQPDWDRRPDPARFTLREALAHLADWEAIWRQRVEAIARAPGSAIQGRDPDELARKNAYAQQDPLANLVRFAEGRAAYVAALKTLDVAGWAKAGRHSDYGPITVGQVAQYALGHDAYHLRQVSEWLDE